MSESNVEIERKFLVHGEPWTEDTRRVEMTQGYLARSDAGVVRIRVEGERAFLTIKGPTEGIRRSEFEYEIPAADARAMLELCLEPPVGKTRYFIEAGDHVFEVDVFTGDNEGLVLAEVELASEDEAFPRPDWLGEEVSHDHRYSNSNLACQPFNAWRG